MDAEAMGKRIAQLRKARNLTQQQLADQLNVTNRAISRWERGEGYPEITLLPKLADSLGVTTDEILGHKTRKQPGMRFAQQPQVIIGIGLVLIFAVEIARAAAASAESASGSDGVDAACDSGADHRDAAAADEPALRYDLQRIRILFRDAACGPADLSVTAAVCRTSAVYWSSELLLFCLAERDAVSGCFAGSIAADTGDVAAGGVGIVVGVSVFELEVKLVRQYFRLDQTGQVADLDGAEQSDPVLDRIQADSAVGLGRTAASKLYTPVAALSSRDFSVDRDGAGRSGVDLAARPAGSCRRSCKPFIAGLLRQHASCAEAGLLFL